MYLEKGSRDKDWDDIVIVQDGKIVLILSWDIMHQPAKDLDVTMDRDVHHLKRVAERGLSESREPKNTLSCC